MGGGGKLEIVRSRRFLNLSLVTGSATGAPVIDNSPLLNVDGRNSA